MLLSTKFESKHQRSSIRLKNYDYSQAGRYFITVCTHNKSHLFGIIEDKKMHLNKAGELIEETWKRIIHKCSNIELDEYIIMPNHFHAIIEIKQKSILRAPYNRAATRAAPTLFL